MSLVAVVGMNEVRAECEGQLRWERVKLRCSSFTNDVSVNTCTANQRPRVCGLDVVLGGFIKNGYRMEGSTLNNVLQIAPPFFLLQGNQAMDSSNTTCL